MSSVGLIAFANNSGLGIQTKRLYDMLKPDKVMIVDSRGFSKNKELHLEWYPEGSLVTDGFPRNYDIIEFIEGLDTVLTVENPYNFYLIKACRERGIKTVVQTNYEFCENVYAPWLPVPDLFLMPSYWKLSEMYERFGYNRVIYLPPPIDPDEFRETYRYNDDTALLNPNQPKKFLHIVGTLAHEDRNGTLDLLQAVKRCKQNFELTLHSQHKLPDEYMVDDDRVVYRIHNFEKNADLYKGFNALILPRRYGGLSLTTNEALMSGLPVMMPDISPNNELLPSDWVTPVASSKKIKIRMELDCYSSDIDGLAAKIDEWAKKTPSQVVARNMGVLNFSTKNLKERYRTVLR